MGNHFLSGGKLYDGSLRILLCRSSRLAPSIDIEMKFWILGSQYDLSTGTKACLQNESTTESLSVVDARNKDTLKMIIIVISIVVIVIILSTMCVATAQKEE